MARKRNMKTSTMWQIGLATAAITMLYIHRKRRVALCFRQKFGPEMARASAQFGGGAQGMQRGTRVAVERVKAACGKPFGIF